MTNITIYIARGTCLAVGAALAGVSMHASYEAAARVGNDYLMIAAPLVALAAPSTAVFIEIACNARQYLKALALLLVFGLCSATVFYTAAERNHDGRAVAEAQRVASRTTAERAERELSEAKADAKAATLAANKVRGAEKCGPKCQSIKASETAAISRVAAAEQAVRNASSHAVTDSSIQQADWLMPLAIDFASVVMLWAGFGLGRIKNEPKVITETVYVVEPVMIEVPAKAPEVKVDTPVAEEKVPAKKRSRRPTAHQIAARKGVETKKRKLREAAIAADHKVIRM
jgi:hypothetical protein